MRRQIARQKKRALGENHSALDHVSELADVSRPRMRKQRFHRFVLDAFNRLAMAHASLLQEMISKVRNIFHPIAKRRDLDRDDFQAIKKILAERSVSRVFLQI